MYPYRVFTLKQANRAVRRVAEVTRDAQEQLDELRSLYRDGAEPSVDNFEAESRATIDRWEQAILEMGAEPKGVFTVDFRSPDPNVLWCWTVDEDEITHRHFTWESFKDRVPIELRKGWLSSN